MYVKKAKMQKMSKQAHIDVVVSLNSNEDESINNHMVGIFVDGHLTDQGTTDNWGNFDSTIHLSKLSRRSSNEFRIEARVEGRSFQSEPHVLTIQGNEIESTLDRLPSNITSGVVTTAKWSVKPIKWLLIILAAGSVITLAVYGVMTLLYWLMLFLIGCVILYIACGIIMAIIYFWQITLTVLIIIIACMLFF